MSTCPFMWMRSPRSKVCVLNSSSEAELEVLGRKLYGRRGAVPRRGGNFGANTTLPESFGPLDDELAPAAVVLDVRAPAAVSSAVWLRTLIACCVSPILMYR